MRDLQLIAPLVLVVLSNAAYQLICKNTPSSLSPFTGLFVSYGVSCLLSGALMVLTKKGPLLGEFAQIRPIHLLLGAVIIGVEGGYLLMYRSGWEVSKGPLTAYIGTAMLLLLFGVILYQETVSVKKLLGIVCCLIGIVLVSVK